MGWGFQFSFSSNELAHHSTVCTQSCLPVSPAKIPTERWHSDNRTLWGLCYTGTWLWYSMTKGTARHTFVSSRTEGDTPGMPHMATALQPSRSWGWALACFAFIMASASHSCATLQPCSQHTLQTHWAMILLGQNSSNMSYKPTQCPKNLISSGSALLQILLQAVAPESSYSSSLLGAWVQIPHRLWVGKTPQWFHASILI